MIGVYLIENKITKECYIGQSKNIEKRFLNHKDNAKNKKYALYVDMRYYGGSNFNYSVLELCSTNQLDEREMYWIKKYQDDGRSLYNIIGVPQKERNYAKRRNKKRFKKY